MTSRDRPLKERLRERLWAAQANYAPYFFVAPFVLLFSTFLLYPLVRSLFISLYQTAGQRMQWVGTKNYSFLLHDDVLRWATLNTIGYTVAFILFQIPAALGLALLLNNPKVRGRNLFRFAFFAPHLVGQVFVALIFNMLFNNNGPVNAALRMIVPGAEFKWLASPIMAREAVVIASMWLSVGFGMIYFLAALQTVDRELYEASEVDGANAWHKFWNVTIPGIKPVLSFMILTGTIGGLQLFELPYVLFSGPGPGAAGLTIVSYLFSWVDMGELGTGAAIGWLLAAVIITIAIFQVRIMGGKNADA